MDAGPGSTTSRPCNQRLVCDDFERNAAGAAPLDWRLEVFPSDSGKLAVDTTRAVSGSNSVKMTITNNVLTNTRIHRSLTPANSLKALYGRVRLWTTGDPNNVGHWDFVNNWGYVPGVARTPQNQAWYTFGGGWGTLSAFNLAPGLDCCMPCSEQGKPGPTLPHNRWVCLEWRADTEKHEMQFWIDGKLIPELTVKDPTTAGSCIGKTYIGPEYFETVSVGWLRGMAQAAGPLETWIDDFSIDTQPIGCDLTP